MDKAVARGTLGGGRQHVFVTRNATINYLLINGMDKEHQFESGRRALTERLLTALPDPSGDAYLLVSPIDPRRKLRAFVVPEGGLLVVTKVAEMEPLPVGNEQPYTSGPARR